MPTKRFIESNWHGDLGEVFADVLLEDVLEAYSIKRGIAIGYHQCP